MKVSLGATESIKVQWSPKVSDQPKMELLSSVTNHSRFTIRDGLIHTDTKFEYQILRGELKQVRIVVPKKYRILDVTADAKIKGWEVKVEAMRQLITLPLLSPKTGKFTVEVHTEANLPEGTFRLFGMKDKKTPFGIHALDALRESGQIVIRHDSELEVSVIKREGLVRIDANEITSSLKNNANLAYKFYNPNAVLSVKTRPVLPKVTVTNTSSVGFLNDELKLNTTLSYLVQPCGSFWFAN